MMELIFFFQAEDGIRDAQESRGLGDVYKRQAGIKGLENYYYQQVDRRTVGELGLDSLISVRQQARDKGKALSTYAMKGNSQGVEGKPPGAKAMDELVAKAKIRINRFFIEKAVKELKRVVPGSKNLDMNQWDIVMRRLGVASPFVRHKMFEAMDTDGNNKVDFREFVDGLSRLWAGNTALKVRVLWDHLCGKEELGRVALEKLVRECGLWREGAAVGKVVHQLVFALDVNDDKMISYDEFHLALNGDRDLLQLVDRIGCSKPIVQRMNDSRASQL
eukprot:TRINITY_DN37836_c0_g1_i1.p1 TRINITY_DN37836_c0_g1~~TRINITY_DN37836_c0_g1_i1.p1  ORF type:complete len:276 (+),score=93.76 TRINITY_DN37836_c0_g1_i1:117-944(+)